MPSLNRSGIWRICSALVSALFTEVTQHIHSFLASGVSSFHVARIFGLAASAFFISAGTACTTPCATLVMLIWYYSLHLTRECRLYMFKTG